MPSGWLRRPSKKVPSWKPTSRGHVRRPAGRGQNGGMEAGGVRRRASSARRVCSVRGFSRKYLCDLQLLSCGFARCHSIRGEIFVTVCERATAAPKDENRLLECLPIPGHRLGARAARADVAVACYWYLARGCCPIPLPRPKCAAEQQAKAPVRGCSLCDDSAAKMRHAARKAGRRPPRVEPAIIWPIWDCSVSW